MIRKLPPRFERKLSQRLRRLPASIEERKPHREEELPPEVRPPQGGSDAAIKRHAAMVKLWLLSGEMQGVERERRREIWQEVVQTWPGAKRIWRDIIEKRGGTP